MAVLGSGWVLGVEECLGAFVLELAWVAETSLPQAKS